MVAYNIIGYGTPSSLKFGGLPFQNVLALIVVVDLFFFQIKELKIDGTFLGCCIFMFKKPRWLITE